MSCERNREIGQRLFDTRKSPVAMARVIGFPFIFKYVDAAGFGVDDVERKMEELLGGDVRRDLHLARVDRGGRRQAHRRGRRGTRARIERAQR